MGFFTGFFFLELLLLLFFSLLDFKLCYKVETVLSDVVHPVDSFVHLANDLHRSQGRLSAFFFKDVDRVELIVLTSFLWRSLLNPFRRYEQAVNHLVSCPVNTLNSFLYLVSCLDLSNDFLLLDFELLGENVFDLRCDLVDLLLKIFYIF